MKVESQRAIGVYYHYSKYAKIRVFTDPYYPV